MRRRTRTVVSLAFGFVVSLGVLALLVRVVGVDAVLDALRGASLLAIVAVYVVALCWMTAWSLSLHVVLESLDVETDRTGSFLLYLVMLFVNGVAPFSVGGGEPIAAALVARYTNAGYERSLQSVLSTSVINYIPAPILGVLGIVYLGLTDALDSDVAGVAASLVAVVVVGAVLALILWRARRRVERAAVSVLVVLQHLTRLLPLDRWVPSPSSIRRRVASFVAGFERVSADQRVVTVGLASSTFGWLLQATVLWTSMVAVGEPVPYVLAVTIATVVAVVDVVPLPGGIGTVDATLVVLLVVAAGVPSPTATAGAFVYRSAILGFPVVLGIGSLGVLHAHHTLRG